MMIREMTPTDAQASDGLLLIDVREPFEFAGVHASGASNHPLGQLDPQHLQTLAGDRTIGLLCQGGGRATQAAKQLVAAGVEKVVVIRGGTQAWTEANLPVERAAKAVMSVDRQMRLVAGSIALTGAILAQWVHPGFIWLSGGVGFGLAMAGITGICPMIGLLGKMPWNKTPTAATGSTSPA